MLIYSTDKVIHSIQHFVPGIVILSSTIRSRNGGSHRSGAFERVRHFSSSNSTGHRRKTVIIPVAKTGEEEGNPYWLQRGYYFLPAGLLLSIAGAAYFVHQNDEKRAIPKGENSRGDRSSSRGPVIGGPFTLYNPEHGVVTEHNFLGKWVLLYFGYTSSPDVGPEQLNTIAKTIELLESKQKLKPLPVFVTIDPQRDSPAHLSTYLKEFDSRIVGLSGSVAAMRQMAQEYRVYFRKIEEEGGDYLVESSHNMYLLNPNMEVARCFGVEYTAEELVEAIREEMERSNASKK